MNEEKIKEILKELSRPKKFEVGFVDARRIVADGLSIIGLDATDILGFAKEENETKSRRVKGSQAWFKKMYEDGWRYKGAFEYEGLRLLYNGFVLMEKEIPNKRLGELIETLTDERVIRTAHTLEIDRGPELPKLLKEAMSEKAIPYIPLDEITREISTPFKKVGDLRRAIEKTREPKEGFYDEIDDFIVDAQKGLKGLEELFFDETGKNAIWRGKETKAFKQWKESRD